MFEVILDEHADHVILDPLIFGDADTLAAQALDVGAEVEVAVLYLPGALLADPVQVLLRQQPAIGASVIGVVDADGQLRIIFNKQQLHNRIYLER